MSFRLTGKTLRKIAALLTEEQAEDLVAVNLMPQWMIKVADFLHIPSYSISIDSLVSVMAGLPLETTREIHRLLFNHNKY